MGNHASFDTSNNLLADPFQVSKLFHDTYFIPNPLIQIIIEYIYSTDENNCICFIPRGKDDIIHIATSEGYTIFIAKTPFLIQFDFIVKSKYPFYIPVYREKQSKKKNFIFPIYLFLFSGQKYAIYNISTSTLTKFNEAPSFQSQFQLVEPGIIENFPIPNSNLYLNNMELVSRTIVSPTQGFDEIILIHEVGCYRCEIHYEAQYEVINRKNTATGFTYKLKNLSTIQMKSTISNHGFTSITLFSPQHSTYTTGLLSSHPMPELHPTVNDRMLYSNLPPILLKVLNKEADSLSLDEDEKVSNNGSEWKVSSTYISFGVTQQRIPFTRIEPNSELEFELTLQLTPNTISVNLVSLYSFNESTGKELRSLPILQLAHRSIKLVEVRAINLNSKFTENFNAREHIQFQLVLCNVEGIQIYNIIFNRLCIKNIIKNFHLRIARLNENQLGKLCRPNWFPPRIEDDNDDADNSYTYSTIEIKGRMFVEWKVSKLSPNRDICIDRAVEFGPSYDEDCTISLICSEQFPSQICKNPSLFSIESTNNMDLEAKERSFSNQDKVNSQVELKVKFLGSCITEGKNMFEWYNWILRAYTENKGVIKKFPFKSVFNIPSKYHATRPQFLSL